MNTEEAYNIIAKINIFEVLSFNFMSRLDFLLRREKTHI